MAEQVFLAVDVGASSGRVVAGLFDGQRLRLEEVHRFENGGVAVGGRLYWDVLRQWSDIRAGLQKASAQYGGRIASIGVDTWGVDFGFLDKNGELLGHPLHYRDHHTDGVFEKAFAMVPRAEIFGATGLQFMQFNSLFQLLALKVAASPVIDSAARLLMMPDLFHWLMTGVAANEFTNATTTQFLDPRTRQWATALLDRFSLPTRILGEIVPPGTRLGKLLPSVAAETGLAGVQVVAPGTHDTASAVAGVPAVSSPASRPDWCYISSGTWSLMGVETPEPIISDRSLEWNFTNEGGVGNAIRLLKNIGGLWLVQECRRIWNQAGKNYSWDDLNRRSAAAKPLAHLVDPDDHRFLAPANMPETIREYCLGSGQSAPPDDGAIVRCALESLALAYRRVLGWLEELTDGRIEIIHIVGGGAQNRALCQFAADACQRRVLAGPVEATAIGNAMVQAIASGEVRDLAQAREVIRRSFSVDEYQPRDATAWDAAYERFSRLGTN